MFEKIREHFSEILGWVIGLLGVIATLLSANGSSTNGLSYVFLGVIATEIVLSGIGAWNLKIKYSYEKKERELQSQLENTKKEINLLKEVRDDKDSEKNKYFSVIVTNIKNASKLNNELCNRIPNITEETYHLLEVLEENGITNEELRKNEIFKSYNSFSIGLFDLFKRYSSHISNYTVNILEAYLRLKENSHNVAVTIKLFDKPLCLKDNNLNDILVYTAFRDKRTYDEHVREIGENLYTINGNADFQCCLQKDHFVINNAHRDSESYYNEHKDFDAYYNCAAVAALRVKQTDGSFKFLGYLCCDTLNKDLNKEIFDKEVGQLLFSMAQLYATFLETLNSNWIDKLQELQDKEGMEQTFFEVIYRKIYCGKNSREFLSEKYQKYIQRK